MDVGTISNFIGTLGFPIAMCVYMVYNNEKTHKRHSEETAELTKLINNNTIALTKLTDRLEMSGVMELEKEREHD